MRKKQITLVPVGGLGNRIEAISSAIAFCIEKKWDYGLRIVDLIVVMKNYLTWIQSWIL